MVYVVYAGACGCTRVRVGVRGCVWVYVGACGCMLVCWVNVGACRVVRAGWMWSHGYDYHNRHRDREAVMKGLLQKSSADVMNRLYVH